MHRLCTIGVSADWTVNSARLINRSTDWLNRNIAGRVRTALVVWSRPIYWHQKKIGLDTRTGFYLVLFLSSLCYLIFFSASPPNGNWYLRVRSLFYLTNGSPGLPWLYTSISLLEKDNMQFHPVANKTSLLNYIFGEGNPQCLLEGTTDAANSPR